MNQTNVRVLVVSPVTFREFRQYFPVNIPVEELLKEQHRHRYEMFCEFKGWRSRHIYRDDEAKIECDAYDRDSTVYSLAVDEGYNFLGGVRCYSTLQRYMLEEDEFDGTCFPGFELPKAPDVFEGSRIISPNSTLYKGTRDIKDIRVGSELLLSQLEIGRLLGVREMIATMPPTLREKAYGRNMDWETTVIGPPCIIKDSEGHVLDKGDETQNYLYAINAGVETRIRAKTGLQRRVSHFGVRPEILPDLVAHMKETVNRPHPHRFPHMVPKDHTAAAQPAGLKPLECAMG